MVRCTAAPLNGNFHFPWYSMAWHLCGMSSVVSAACDFCGYEENTQVGLYPVYKRRRLDLRVGFGPKRSLRFAQPLATWTQ